MAIVLIIASVVVAALLGISTNLISDRLPNWLTNNIRIVYGSFIGLVVVLIIISISMYMNDNPSSGQSIPSNVSAGQETAVVVEPTTLPTSISAIQTPIPTIAPTVSTNETQNTVSVDDSGKPQALLRFEGDGVIVAGSNQDLHLILRASVPTKWNALAFVSDCDLKGIHTGIATEPIDETEHIITTTAYIPPEAANKSCTITGEVTTYDDKYGSTSIPIEYKFEVRAPNP
jgi:hypothetical protein